MPLQQLLSTADHVASHIRCGLLLLLHQVSLQKYLMQHRRKLLGSIPLVCNCMKPQADQPMTTRQTFPLMRPTCLATSPGFLLAPKLSKRSRRKPGDVAGQQQQTLAGLAVRLRAQLWPLLLPHIAQWHKQVMPPSRGLACLCWGAHCLCQLGLCHLSNNQVKLCRHSQSAERAVSQTRQA